MAVDTYYDLREPLRKSILSRPLEIVDNAAILGDRYRSRIFLVGGTVRDMLLGRRSRDIDMAVEGDAIEIGKTLAFSLGSEIKCYPKFGTCTLLFSDKKCRFHGIRVDIASARRENYLFPGSYPEVRKSTICEDLARRDFTVNAMAMGINGKNKGVVIDLFSGSGDLKKKLVRVLYDESFSDDPARVFRAVRFEARLGFHIEDHTLGLIRECSAKGTLRHIGKNRLRDEWALILAEKRSEKCLARLEDILGDEFEFVRRITGAKQGE